MKKLPNWRLWRHQVFTWPVGGTVAGILAWYTDLTGTPFLVRFLAYSGAIAVSASAGALVAALLDRARTRYLAERDDTGH